MVVFTCDACGESLKKNQVEKHYTTKCRRCSVVSCMDCGKEFKGDSFKEHTKCISEEEKYSGQDWKPKPNANKGEVKQEKWTEQVEAAIAKCNNPKLKPVLHKLKDYPKIPKKKAKFVNFMQNSVRVYPNQIEQVWDVLMAHKDKPTVQANGDAGSCEENLVQPAPQVENGDHKEKKLNKREKKEERQKQATKSKKSQHVKEEENTEDEPVQKTKKNKKKRKHEDNDEENVDGQEKVKKMKTEGDDGRLLVNDVEEDIEPEKATNVKFSWDENIRAILEKKGEISLKRLRKKIVAEYMSQGGFYKSEEKLLAKAEKKVTKNPLFKVHKEKVKLAAT